MEIGLNKIQEDVLKRKLSFDLYGRYSIIKEIIDHNRFDGKKFKVIDIGGRGNLLKQFLVNDEVYYLDLSISTNDENYIQGDGCNLPFEENEFDWVVSADVFEHISPGLRNVFVSEQLRVAKIGVILVAPFYSAEVEQAERNANELYRKKYQKDHMWLIEHAENGLPKEKELEQFIKGYNYQKFYNNNLENWQFILQLLFLIEDNLSENQPLQRKLSDFNYFYNTIIQPLDNDSNSYRKVYYIKKDINLKDYCLNSNRISLNTTQNLFNKAFELLLYYELNEKEKNKLEQERLNIGWEYEFQKKNEELNQKNEKLNRKNEELNQKTEELNQKTEELNQKTEELNQKTEELNQKNEEISQIMVSRSWRITKPLRAIFKFLNNFSLNLVLQKSVWYTSKVIFHLLPFSGIAKDRLKKGFFSKFAGLYNTIKSNEIGCFVAYTATNFEKSIQENRNRVIQKVAFQNNIPISEMPVKVLAFYLPQFHAIPENDAWWGDGFTEWTNVKPAQPQFEGHYQPHIPGELGYYNLLDVKIQERQVELAKNYGIGGFCFHYYWFNGKRLLEKPIENYLINPQMDFPFCISWANENWTRRWDGRENEILMKQHHSPEDDLAFIQHVSKYMFDNRYIRINNKPLLVVYRPGILPSAKDTAESWRNWCRKNGIGEIYLAYVQSFESPHPAEIGYDAAIEFPPNSFNPLIVNNLIKPLNNEFKCNVFDWNTMVMNSELYSIPDFKLFRGVCPSWDNTPRRKSESHVFINSHPDDFQKWVYNSAKDTISRFENPDERLIFVNAWNEWAEGAHLEPDEKYGYAYLQSIYDVLHKLANTKKSLLSNNNV